MVPFESHVARPYVTAARLDFTPAFPDSPADFVTQSTYDDRVCPTTVIRTGSVWVMTAMSPHFERDLARYAACGGLSIRSQTEVGYVRIARLARK